VVLNGAAVLSDVDGHSIHSSILDPGAHRLPVRRSAKLETAVAAAC